MLARFGLASLVLVGCWEPTETGEVDADSMAESEDEGTRADRKVPRHDTSVVGGDVGPVAPRDADTTSEDTGPSRDATHSTLDMATHLADIAPPTADMSIPAADGAVDPPDAIILPPEIPAGYVRIEAGEFIMGSPGGPEPPAEPARQDDETQHEVTLTHAFLMKATEVTQWEWETLMGDRPSGFPDCGPTCPVETVAWFEAVAYCNALSSAEGLARCYADTGGDDYDRRDAMNEVIPVWRDGLDCLGYRLPTEQEWEYAARAGTTEASYAGPVGDVGCDPDPSLDAIAWYCGNSDFLTHPVALKAPNAWGLYDMLGNVWEWNWDWYGDYPEGPGRDDMGAPGGGFRVQRGGALDSDPAYARSANRNGGDPGYWYVYSNMGFRPARTL